LLALLVLLATAGLFVGCSEEGEGNKGKGDEAAFHQPVVAAFEEAGFDEPAFEDTAARPYKAEECVRGEVKKLDVLVCRFAEEAAAKQGEKAMVQFFGGAVSGAVRRAGLTVLAVADRQKSDPTGESINKLLEAFDGTEPAT
jgi:hypothetical protein